MTLDRVSGKERHWWIIANPTAQSNKCKARLEGYKQSWNEMGVQYEFHETTHAGHASVLAIEAIRKGFEYILIMGGDGTLHEAVNGIMSQDISARRQVHLAIVPLGTANDWARYYGYPTDISVVNQLLTNGKMSMQDAGQVFFPETGKTHFFINVFGAGYDGYVAKKLQSGAKKRWGKASYLITVAKGLFTYRAERTIVSHATGKTWKEDEFFSINAGITRYSGNGMQLVPHAIPDDGLLGVTLIRKMPVWRLFLNLYRLFSGTLIRHKLVSHSQEKAITLDFGPSGSSIDVEADGEWMGRTPVIVSCIAGAIGIVLPV